MWRFLAVIAFAYLFCSIQTYACDEVKAKQIGGGIRVSYSGSQACSVFKSILQNGYAAGTTPSSIFEEKDIKSMNSKSGTKRFVSKTGNAVECEAAFFGEDAGLNPETDKPYLCACRHFIGPNGTAAGTGSANQIKVRANE